MNGNRYIFDTNAVISLLKGNSYFLDVAENAEWIGISIISYLEFMAFPDLSDEDKSLFESFVRRIEVVGLGINDLKLIDKIIKIKIKYRIKLPDAIIVSSAIITGSSLVTDYKQLQTVEEIRVVASA